MTNLFTSGVAATRSAPGRNLKILLRIAVALGVVVALGIAGHYAFGQKPLQATEEPRDQSMHHTDLDNRADLIGVEQDFMRGATIFNDPGYRDLPNAAQMQLSPGP